jgi:ATP-binding cassette subfamily C (CFTR/MRP) protein 1
MWLTKWSTESDLTKSENWKYYGIFTAMSLGSPIMLFLRFFLLSITGIKCSRRLHSEMISSITDAPINLFHDIIPKGQLLNKLSKDLSAVDMLIYSLSGFLVYVIFLIGALVVCAIFMYYSLIVFLISFIIGIFITRFYLNASRDLERLDGVSRSPIIDLLTETIHGVITIRAHEKEKDFLQLFYAKLDHYLKIKICQAGVSAWFAQTLDLISLMIYVMIFIFVAIFEDNFSSISIGLLFTYLLLLEKCLYKVLVTRSTLENAMVGVERCLSLTDITPEKELELPSDKNIKNNCFSGDISFVDYSCRYRPGTNLVLKNLNFEIKAAQKIGVVGRTGSGKSTLCLSIFRILEPEQGTILMSGVDITKVGLRFLRSQLSIIPQDPILMEGTLRSNIDPFKCFTDQEIVSILVRIGFNKTNYEGSSLLELNIEENGKNLSVGEKQLVCIARAIVRVSS